MGNCFSSACVLVKRLNFLPNCLISSDDQVEHLELPENGSISHADERNEFPQNGLISPADDHINQQESPVDGLVSPSDDKLRYLDSPESGLVSPADDRGRHLESPANGFVSPVVDQGNHAESKKNDFLSPKDDELKNLESKDNSLIFHADLLQHLEHIENKYDLIVPVKDQIQTLKVELRFLITYLKGLQGNDLPNYSLGEQIKAFLQDTAVELSSLCLRPTTDRRTTRDLQNLISKMQNELENYKPMIKSNYLTVCFDSKRNFAPTKYGLLMELIDSLLQNLKDLQGRTSNLIVSMKKQIEAFEEKLLFMRNLFRFSEIGISYASLGVIEDSGDSNDPEKLESLLTGIKYVVDNAAFLSYCCLVDEEDENMRLKCNFCYLVWMMNNIEVEVKEMCVTFLKDKKLLTSGTLPFNFHRIVATDSLLDNLVQLHNCEYQLVAPVKDIFLILYDELIFLRAFLMDPPPSKHTGNEKMDSLLTNVEPFFSEAGSIICSFLDKMEEETADKMKLVLSDLIEKISLIKSAVKDGHVGRLNHLQSNVLGVDGVACIDFLLKNLNELLNCQADSIVILRNQIESVHDELSSLRFSLEHIARNIGNHDVKHIMKCVIDVTHKAEYVINSYVARDCPVWYHILWISDILEEFKQLKVEIRDIINSKSSLATETNVGKTTPLWPTQAHTEVVIGFQDETKKIIDTLIGGSKDLDLVSIVGMAGLGKTTLAKKVYNHRSVANHFHLRAWCCVSQAYQKKKLLLEILSHIIQVTDKFDEMSEADLAGLLYKCLKHRKYLIVIDDIWNSDPWYDLRRCFPDDDNGSRIMMTSRIHGVASEVKHYSSPLHLKSFSAEESWELFEKTLFQQEKCPVELVDVGQELSRNCKGLPLAIVVIAGTLAKMDKKYDQWEKVAKSLSAFRGSDSSRQYMDILDLSYSHLPQHLKPCFLYFGAFAAGKEISVKKLLWLWIAEGLVQKIKHKTVEDTAEDYLVDLIDRSLVIVDKTRSKGGVKTCHVHDLLHDLCLEKAKQNFLRLINGYDELYAPYSGDFGVRSNHYPFFPSVFQQARLSIYCGRNDFFAWKPANRQIRSLLFFATDDRYSADWTYPWDFSVISYSLRLLKVLDLSCISFGDSFPNGIQFLVLLKFLAIRGGMRYIPSFIAKLLNLEILFVKGVKGEVELPDTIWEMVPLKHLHIKHRAAFILLKGRPDVQLPNIETLSTPCFSFGDDTKNLIRAFPKLRKLKCIFMESWDPISDCNRFPILESLNRLESLKVIYQGRVRKSPNFNFPSHLRKLSLTDFCLPWSEISVIAKLPNLEVLKLLFRAFEGKIWDMKDNEFLKLKYLKLDTLNFEQWNVSCDHFPCLERLVLHRCKRLEEIPCSFGRLPTLQLIEMKSCKSSAAETAKQIQEEQNNFGNEEFEVIINTSS